MQHCCSRTGGTSRNRTRACQTVCRASITYAGRTIRYRRIFRTAHQTAILMQKPPSHTGQTRSLIYTGHTWRHTYHTRIIPIRIHSRITILETRGISSGLIKILIGRPSHTAQTIRRHPHTSLTDTRTGRTLHIHCVNIQPRGARLDALVGDVVVVDVGGDHGVGVASEAAGWGGRAGLAGQAAV